MHKIALGLGATLNTAFYTPDAIKSIKKGKEVRTQLGGNTYDKLLRNKPTVSKKPLKDGDLSDKMMNILASDIIDGLYKEAYEKKSRRHDNRDTKSESKVPKALATALGVAALGSAVQSRNALQPFKDIGRGSKYMLFTLPKAIGTAGGRTPKVISKGIEKGFKYYKKDKKRPGAMTRDQAKKELSYPGKFLGAAGLGAGVGAGNLAVHLIGDKYFDNKTVRKSFNAPIKSEIQDFKDAEKRTYNKKKSKYRDNRRKFSSGYNRNKDKKASEIIDRIFEKYANVAELSGQGSKYHFINKKHHAKKILQEDVLQNALRSIPFFTVPLGVSHLVNRDVKSGMEKMKGEGSKGLGTKRIIIEMPEDSLRSKLKKTAAKKGPEPYKIMSMKDFAKGDLPGSVARSLSWTIPISTLTAITGRNIRGQGEKVQNIEPLEEGKARIIIEDKPKNKHGDVLFK